MPLPYSKIISLGSLRNHDGHGKRNVAEQKVYSVEQWPSTWVIIHFFAYIAKQQREPRRLIFFSVFILNVSLCPRINSMIFSKLKTEESDFSLVGETRFSM